MLPCSWWHAVKCLLEKTFFYSLTDLIPNFKWEHDLKEKKENNAHTSKILFMESILLLLLFHGRAFNHVQY